MADDDEEPTDMGNLELYEGDVSMIIRADGEVEFLIAHEGDESDEYHIALKMVHFLKFALESDACRDLFERSLHESHTLN